MGVSIPSGGSKPPGPEEDRRNRPSEDDLFEVLSNERRRHAVRVLSGSEGPVEMADLAEAVAVREYGIDADELETQQRRRVYTALRQSHVPKLAEKDVVEFDPDEREVRPDDRLPEYGIYVVEEDRLPWCHAYLGLAAVMSALAGAVWAGVAPFSLVPARVWLWVVPFPFLLTAVAHALATRRVEPRDDDC